ncbi:MAG: glycosyltransferase family 9 protein [Ignavibacteria bacterium]|nr:glycosyltransferase family 9 protein [Ignavibacteria bacterium]
MKKFLKSCELFLKKYLQHFVYKSKTKPKKIDSFEQADFLIACKKVLFLRHDRIGDLIVSAPIVKKFRVHYPSYIIHILLSSRNIVAKSCIENYVDKIIVLERKFFGLLDALRILKKEKYDLIIDLFDNPSLTSSLLIKFLKPKFSIGFEKENCHLYTHIVELPSKSTTHIVERLKSLLYIFGIREDTIDLEYPKKETKLLPTRKKPRVGINISGSSFDRYWGTDKFEELIKKIQNRFGYEIVLFGTKKYRKELESLSNNEDVILAPFTQKFDEFAAMLATCNYIVTPDTSVAHIASAYKIPSLVFYHFVDEKFGMPWFPYKSPFRALLSTKSRFDDISPDEAFQKFVSLVELE